LGLVALSAFGVGCGRGSAPRNVLLVTLDTLRADRVGSYGYTAAQTPALDGLAARGARFASATTTTPLTLSAHTSLFTGTFPTFHAVRDNTGFHVEDSLTTMAEVLKARGYRTGGFVGAFVLDARWGIAQGFDDYFDDFDLTEDVGPGLDAIQRRGADVVDRALAWLGQPSEQPFFGWVHLYDPHTPYAAPAEYASRFPATRDGAYDAEVAYTDAQVARLLAALDAAGRRDDTLVVVLSDHGEQLGEHREQSHGFFVYDATVQIPLIVAGPGVSPRVVPDQVRIIDVMPTVLDLVGVALPDGVHGTSLRPALDGQRQELLAFSESWYPRFHYGWSELQAVRDGAFKFILAPARELYDVAKDPGELTNLAGAIGFSIPLARLDWDENRPQQLHPYVLLELVVSLTRLAAVVYGPQGLGQGVERMLGDIAVIGGKNWSLPAHPPGTWGYLKRHDEPARMELDNLDIGSPRLFALPELIANPDRPGVELVRALYQAFGLPRDRLPRDVLSAEDRFLPLD
jgi:arylsulfatase A-like enzyme